MAKSVHNDDTRPCKLHFINKTDRTIAAVWVDYEGQEKEYESIDPGKSFLQSGLPNTHLLPC